jgi:hypothetical protein
MIWRSIVALILILAITSMAVATQLPAIVEAMLKDDSLDEQIRQYVKSSWPAEDLERVVVNWGMQQRSGITEDARSILIALTLVARYQISSSLGTSPAVVNEAAQRALLTFLADELPYESVTTLDALISSQLGNKPITIKEVNRIGTVTLPPGTTSVDVTAAGSGAHEHYRNVTRIVVAQGQYTLLLKVNDQSCSRDVVVKAGETNLTACP